MNSFAYDDGILSSCARNAIANPDHQDCRDLFLYHTSHYFQQETDQDPTLKKMNQGYEHFLKNVIFVHDHNSQKNLHKVGLNQFSSMPQERLPLYFAPREKEDSNSTIRDANGSIFMINHIRDVNYAKTLLSLQTEQNFMKRRRQKNSYLPFISHKENKIYQNPKVDDSVYPFLIEKQKHGTYHLGDEHFREHHKKITEFVDDPTGANWTTNLNWASEDNPDGVSLVHPAVDQGSCGSCWAIASTGTMEAMASRRIGLKVYKSGVDRLSKTISGANEIHVKAVEWAQKAEKRALDHADLSIQELIDCDTEYDRGCMGGNPVSAFPFIRRHGLVSSVKYPYIEKQKRCHKKRLYLYEPIATADSWGLLEAKNEKIMENVLRYLGPIAAGFNGNDKSFVHYKSGIFNSTKCGKRPNHAMLIVGYGQKEIHGKVEKFWIARNSWGAGWGMDGYIWVKRGKGTKSGGVCGIGKNPSIAIGATLINTDELHGDWLHGDWGPSSNNRRKSQDSTMREQEPVYGTSHFCVNLRPSFVRSAGKFCPETNIDNWVYISVLVMSIVSFLGAMKFVKKCLNDNQEVTPETREAENTSLMGYAAKMYGSTNSS